MVRSFDSLRAPKRATALSRLIHQRRLTPSCGGHAPTAERTVGPARTIVESLTPRPGIREQYRSNSAAPPHDRRGCCTPESCRACRAFITRDVGLIRKLKPSLKDCSGRADQQPMKAYLTCETEGRIFRSTRSPRNTSQPNTSISIRTTIDPTAAIGSPTACPVCARPTPIVRMTARPILAPSLWLRLSLPLGRKLRCLNYQRREARRSAGPATDQIPACDQPRDRQEYLRGRVTAQ